MNATDPNASTMAAIIFIGIGLVLYFVPAFVAYDRHHPNRFAIGILTLVAGWTFVGWVVALVWACTGERQRGLGAAYEGPPRTVSAPPVVRRPRLYVTREEELAAQASSDAAQAGAWRLADR